MSNNNKPKPPYFEKEQRRRDLKTAKKAVKRNRDDRPPRRRDWTPFVDAEETYEEESSYERIMPRDERDRRNAVVAKMSRLAATEMDEVTPDPELADHQAVGRVMEVSTGLCRVALDGRQLLCHLRGSLSAEETGFTNVVAVGDMVVITQDGLGSGVVEAILPRRSHLARPDSFYSHLRQVIAANVDQLLIVAAWRNPHIWTELIDRYLITAERSQITPIICVNKVDLADSRDEIEAVMQPYHGLGYQIILTSVISGEGLGRLREALQEKVTVLAGLSGVGKSSLLSAIEPEFQLRVGAVNEDYGQGRHTTTQATMLPFGDTGFLVDTPGIREFGLAGLSKRELQAFYREFEAVEGQCRFANCTHLHEPDCAVREAVQAGKISPLRYHNYEHIGEALAD